MTLTINLKEDEQRQMLVTVEVAEERVQAAMRRQAQKLAREFRFPGFRPGKAPYQMLVNRLGEDYIRSQTAEEMGQDVFKEMLEQVDFEPYEQASLTDIILHPLTFHFTVPLVPTVTLGEYRDFRYEVKAVEVTEEAVTHTLEHLQEERKEVKPVDRPVQTGDIVAFTEVVTATNEAGEEEKLFETERAELILDPTTIERGPLFVNNLIGLSAGDNKKFTISYPEDHSNSDMANKAVTFDVTILDVKSQLIPELNDEFAKAEGDYETLEDLRHEIRHNLEKEAERQAIFDLLEVMLAHLKANAQIVYPPIAITKELDDRMERHKKGVSQSGWKWEDFLRLQNETEESLREKWLPAVTESLKNSIVVGKFISLEKLTVSIDDIKAEIQRQIVAYSDDEENQEMMANYLLEGAGREQLLNEVMMMKVHERMTAIASGKAPDLDALVEDEQTIDDEEE